MRWVSCKIRTKPTKMLLANLIHRSTLSRHRSFGVYEVTKNKEKAQTDLHLTHRGNGNELLRRSSSIPNQHTHGSRPPVDPTTTCARRAVAPTDPNGRACGAGYGFGGRACRASSHRRRPTRQGELQLHASSDGLCSPLFPIYTPMHGAALRGERHLSRAARRGELWASGAPAAGASR
jgi:hypothetical protein